CARDVYGSVLDFW
nr:immunoglobulin heavy chain junction region [Macaca mulatta]